MSIQKMYPRRRWRRPRSTKRLPYIHLSAEDIRSFISKGWRVRSSTLYVPVQ